MLNKIFDSDTDSDSDSVYVCHHAYSSEWRHIEDHGTLYPQIKNNSIATDCGTFYIHSHLLTNYSIVYERFRKKLHVLCHLCPVTNNDVPRFLFFMMFWLFNHFHWSHACLSSQAALHLRYNYI